MALRLVRPLVAKLLSVHLLQAPVIPPVLGRGVEFRRLVRLWRHRSPGIHP